MQKFDVILLNINFKFRWIKYKQKNLNQLKQIFKFGFNKSFAL